MRDRRHAELGKIHIARKQLALDDDTYRDMLWTLARVRSAKDLDDAGRQAVLDHLKARGFKARRKRGPTPAGDRSPLLNKVYALLGDRPVTYAEGILRHMYRDTAPARLEWATPEQLHKVVAALSYDKRRRAE